MPDHSTACLRAPTINSSSCRDGIVVIPAGVLIDHGDSVRRMRQWSVAVTAPPPALASLAAGLSGNTGVISDPIQSADAAVANLKQVSAPPLCRPSRFPSMLVTEHHVLREV